MDGQTRHALLLAADELQAAFAVALLDHVLIDGIGPHMIDAAHRRRDQPRKADHRTTRGEQRHDQQVLVVADGLLQFVGLRIYNPNCDIVFSCFLADKEYAVHPQPDIWKNFYGQSFIQESSIQNYCSLNNLELTKCPFFIADGGHKHEIFKINKKEKTKNG